MSEDPPPQTAWCNVCSTCGPATHEDDINCDCDTDGMCLSVGFFIVIFMTIVTACGTFFAHVFPCDAISTFRKSWFRVTSAAALGMAAVLLCVGLFRDWYATEAGHYSTPPCGDRSHTIGLWHSDVSNNDVFFASCPYTFDGLKTTGTLIAIALSISLVVLLLSILAIIQSQFLCATWLPVCGNLVALCTVVAALLVHAVRVRGNTSFCGSGRSLSDLGYTVQAPYYTTVVAAALLALGVVVVPIGKFFSALCDEDDNEVIPKQRKNAIAIAPSSLADSVESLRIPVAGAHDHTVEQSALEHIIDVLRAAVESPDEQVRRAGCEVLCAASQSTNPNLRNLAVALISSFTDSSRRFYEQVTGVSEAPAERAAVEDGQGDWH